MTFTTLVLWDNKAIDFIDDLAIWNFDFTAYDSKVLICTSKADWDEKVLKGSTKKFEKLFVLANLSWARPYSSSLEGLDYFMDCLQHKRLVEENVAIKICSFLDRFTLFCLSPQKFRLAIQKFPIAQLKPECTRIGGEKDENRKHIKATPISHIKYEINRHLCLHQYGQIDILIHDLRNSKIIAGKTDTEFLKFSRLSNSLSFKSEVLFNKVAAIKDLSALESIDVSSFDVLKVDILNLLQIEKEYWQGKENIPLASKKLDNCNLVLVEDNDLSRITLTNWLQRHGANVESFNNANEAIQFIKTGKSRVHALISDLHLVDEQGFEFEKQGIDVIEFCQRMNKEIVIWAITSMPKGTVDKFLQGIKILYKTVGTIHPVGEDEEKIINEIAQEIEKKSYKTQVIGPKTGLVYQYYVFNPRFFKWNEEGKINFEKIKADAKLFFTSDLQIKYKHGILPPAKKLKSIDYKKEWEENPQWLENILFLRLLLLINATSHYINQTSDYKDNFGKLEYRGFMDHENFYKPLPSVPKSIIKFTGFASETKEYEESKCDYITLIIKLSDNGNPKPDDLFAIEYEFITKLISDKELQKEFGIHQDIKT